ncbi:MAG TPA: phage GP46 family protein [Casimicrobiaceae bacterium]|nr:phage GP46 family protein [Casimicrobiaceae bacterium]
MPMPLDGGGDVSLVRNPATGRFDVALDISGNPQFTDTQEHTVLSLLMEKRGGYWADQTGNRGSRLYQIRQDTGRTPKQIEAEVLAALAPAIDDGRIQNVSVNAVRRAPGNFKVSVTYHNRDGHVQNVDLPYGY